MTFGGSSGAAGHTPRRALFIALASVTIAAGLAVHLKGAALGVATRDIAGDALWAMMMAWWVGAAFPARSIRMRSTAAIAICFAVELSQLVHAPLLDAARQTFIGRLTLGTGFDPRDFLSYTCGVLVAAMLERVTASRG